MKVLILVWAFIFAQGPQFIDQYRNHLTGHVEELKYQLVQMQSFTNTTAFNLEETINKWASSVHDEVSRSGQFMQQLYQRYQDFSASLRALNEANPIMLPFSFLRHFNGEIAKETCADFNLGVPITIDALLYALLGGLFGYFFYRLAYSAWKKLRK